MSSEIYKRIALSNLEPKTKLRACEDIKMMEVFKDYREKVAFNSDEVIIFQAFAFNKSVLGADFWFEISKQLDNE